MKLIKITIAIILFGLIILSGCQPGTPQGNYTDDLGRTLKIETAPERIVSLAPSNTEVIYALGLEDKLVGVTTYCNYPPEALYKPRVSEYSNVDIEKIYSLQPDLVLADSIHKIDVIPALEKLDIKVLAVIAPSLDKLIRDIELLGEITDQTETADKLISGMSNRINNITSKTGILAEKEKPRILFVTWYDPGALWTAGQGTMIDDLIMKAGGTNVASDVQENNTISLETVIQRNPQIICVLSSMGDQNTAFNAIKTEARFQATDALKNNQVYKVDSDTFGRTTPRSVDGLETLAELAHPEIFK